MPLIFLTTIISTLTEKSPQNLAVTIYLPKSQFKELLITLSKGWSRDESIAVCLLP